MDKRVHNKTFNKSRKLLLLMKKMKELLRVNSMEELREIIEECYFY